MPTKYQAKIAGVCSKCHINVNIGDYITWPRKGEKGRYHVNCDSPAIWVEQDQQSPATPDVRQPIPIPPEEQGMNEICPKCHKRKGLHLVGTYQCMDVHGVRIYGSYFPGYGPPPPDNTPIPEARIPIPEIPEYSPTPENIPDPNELFQMRIPSPDGMSPQNAKKPSEASPQPNSNNDDLLGLISSKVQDKVLSTVTAKVEASLALIDRKVQEKIDRLAIPSIEIKRPGLPNVKVDNVHRQFKDVLQLLNSGEYVYLHGSPGAGKSHLGPQLAKALGVRFGFRSLSEQTPEYVVTGFTNPVTNEYWQAPFVDFWKNGGLWCFSELDLANDNLRSALNTMLEQKIASLDCGMVPVNDKFYMYADGNTCGRGAHPAFPSRTSFDAAFAARFVFLEFEYDWPLAKHIALGLNPQSGPIVKWAEQASNWALANLIPVIISPREVYKLAKLMVTTDLADTILLDGILRGLDVASKEKLLTNFPFPSISRGQ